MICILTDSTAQFTRPNFPGHELVHIVSFEVRTAPSEKEARTFSTERDLIPRLSGPSARDFLKKFSHLGAEFDTIMIITPSTSLSTAARIAMQAATQYSGRATIQVIDSQTTAVGLGLLVQAAADMAANGANMAEVERRVRSVIHHIYTMFCIPGLTYLSDIGHITRSQAIIGEMLGLLPIYILDEGILSPLGKVRTQRHLLESFQEFVEEFSSPYHIAFVKPAVMNHFHITPLRQFIGAAFPNVPFSEHVIGPHLAALLGPQCMGLVVMENSN